MKKAYKLTSKIINDKPIKICDFDITNSKIKLFRSSLSKTEFYVAFSDDTWAFKNPTHKLWIYRKDSWKSYFNTGCYKPISITKKQLFMEML